MEVSDGDAENSDKGDDIIQRPMGVEECRTKEIKLVGFIWMIMARVRGQDRREEASSHGKQATGPKGRTESFHKQVESDAAFEQEPCQAGNEKTMPFGKGMAQYQIPQNIKLLRILLSLVGAFEERLADNILEFLENLELAICFGFTDKDVFGEVVILLRSHFATWSVE